jgi:hypothetical protein
MISSLHHFVEGARPPYTLNKVGGTMEAAGILHSLFYTTGSPGAAVAPSPGIAGSALTTYAGQIPFTNPPNGLETKLARLSATTTQPGSLLLCDRLWHNSGINVTTTTAQTINSVSWPARCQPLSGLTPNADGFGILVGLEVSAATTNSGAITNMALGYTDEANNAGAVGTMASFPATAAAGTFVPFQLAAGDTGMRSVQSLTLGTSLVTGTVHLVAYRVIAELPMPTANVGAAVDGVTGAGPVLYDNSVPFLLWHPNAVTAVSLRGSIAFAQR